MRMETKFLRLRNAVEVGSRSTAGAFAGWVAGADIDCIIW
jgi:hypothetical protein